MQRLFNPIRFKPFRKLLSLILSSFIIWSNCTKSNSNYPIEKRIENDTEIWINPEYPKHSNQNYELNEILSIGEVEGDTNYIFNYLFDLNIDKDFNIYTLDYSDQKVRIYDKNGIFLNSFGRRGQGPGEFIEPTRILINSKSQIIIYDQKSERITYFTKDGNYISDFTIGDYAKSTKVIGIDQEDNFYITQRLSWNYSNGKERRSFSRVTNTGEILNSITELFGQNGTKNTVSGGLWNTGYEHGAINYAVSNSGRLIVGESSKYLFSIFDKFGNLKKKFGRQYNQIPLTLEDKQRLTKDPKRMSLLPSTKPAFKISWYRFFIDDINDFWVQTFEKENEGITFDIFDQEGVYKNKIFIQTKDGRLKPIFVNNDILYTIHLDIDGVNRVKKYKILTVN